MAKQAPHAKNRFTKALQTTISAVQSQCSDYFQRCTFYAEHSPTDEEETTAQRRNLKEFKRQLRRIAIYADQQLKQK